MKVRVRVILSKGFRLDFCAFAVDDEEEFFSTVRFVRICMILMEEVVWAHFGHTGAACLQAATFTLLVACEVFSRCI